MQERLRTFRQALPATPTTLLWGTVGVIALVIVLFELIMGWRPLGFSLAASLTNGLSGGAVFALIALGVALVYRATRVINFAQGAMGSLPAFLAMTLLLWFQSGKKTDAPGLLDQEIDSSLVATWEFILAIVATVVAGAVLGIAINILVVRRLASASPATSLVATTGVALAVISVEVIVFAAKNRSFPRLIEGAPGGVKLGPVCLGRFQDGQCVTDGPLTFGGEALQWNTLLILALLLAVSLALAAFFRSPVGVALLATAQEPFSAELYGVSPVVMSSLAWGIAGAFAGLAAVLGAGVTESIRPGFMTTSFLVFALVASVLGGLTSMVGAVIGGLVVGVVGSVTNSVVLQLGLNDIPAPPTLAVFVVLLLVLILRPRGLFGKEA